MLKLLILAACLLASPAWAQGRHSNPPLTHLGVPAANLVTVDLSTRSDFSTGVVTTDLGVYENGVWTWHFGAAGFEVPKGRTFVVTDAQGWVLHRSGTGTPASLELMVDHPAGGYWGSLALFSFHDVPANANGVHRQTWTSGIALTEGLRMRIWVQAFYPTSLLTNARILVQGYYL